MCIRDSFFITGHSCRWFRNVKTLQVHSCCYGLLLLLLRKLSWTSESHYACHHEWVVSWTRVQLFHKSLVLHLSTHCALTITSYSGLALYKCVLRELDHLQSDDFLAVLSTISFLIIPQCAGIHWRTIPFLCLHLLVVDFLYHLFCKYSLEAYSPSAFVALIWTLDRMQMCSFSKIKQLTRDAFIIYKFCIHTRSGIW